MEGFSTVKKNIGPVSAPVFFFIVATILFFYDQNSVNHPIVVFISSGIFVVSFLFTAFCYAPVLLREKIKGFILAAIICIVLSASIIYHVSGKIENNLLSENIPEYLNNPIITVNEVKFNKAGKDLYFTTQDKEIFHFKGQLSVKGEIDVEPGDVAVVHKNIKRVDSNVNNKFAQNLLRRGIVFRGYVNADDITFISKNYSVKEMLRGQFFQAIDLIFPKESGAIIKALYSGNKNFISTKVILGFRDSGIMHILAASGLHVGIIASIPLLFLFAGINRKFLLSISLVLVFIYLYLTDMPISLVRASIMYAVVYIQVIANREVLSLNSLFIAGSIVLLLFPWEIYSPGFQLSFGATATIILFYKGYLKILDAFPGFLKKSIAATLAAQIITVPLVFYHMGQINLASIPANLAAVPLVTVIMMFSLLALFLYPLSSFAALVAGKVTHLFYLVLAGLTEFFSGLSLNYFVDSLSLILIASFVFSIIPLIDLKGKNSHKLIVILISCLLPCAALTRFYSESMESIVLSSGKSEIEIITPGAEPLIRLKIKDYEDGRIILNSFLKYNITPSIIEMEQYSFANVIFCKQILGNFIVNKIIINEDIAVKGGMEDIYHISDSENIKLLIKKSY